MTKRTILSILMESNLKDWETRATASSPTLKMFSQTSVMEREEEESN